MKKTQSIWLIAIIWVILFTLGNPSIAAAENSVPIKISLLPYLSYAPIFIALEEGYFTEQGLVLEYVKFNQSGLSMPAFGSRKEKQ